MGDIKCTLKDLEASGGNRGARFGLKQTSGCKPQAGVAEHLRDEGERDLRPGRGWRLGPQARGVRKGAWRAGPASRPGGLAQPEAAGPHLKARWAPRAACEAGKRGVVGSGRGAAEEPRGRAEAEAGAAARNRAEDQTTWWGARWVPRPDEAGLPQPEALAPRLWGSPNFPPRARPPPAGPRRHLPYLRSPGPPFYFLKPSHKAPRPAPGLGLLSTGRVLRLRILLDSAGVRRREARTRWRSGHAPAQ